MKTELLNRGNKFFYIDAEGLDYVITKEQAAYRIAEGLCTVKIEGLEHLAPPSKSVHCFISPKDAVTFGVHTDFENLKILCIEGTKGFEVAGVEYLLREGEFVEVPIGVEHRGLNKYDSIMLSIEI